MKASALNTFFSGRDSGTILKSSISKEVADYSKTLTKLGSTIPLVFHEDEDLVMSNDALATLLRAVLDNRLNSIELSYICDCLTLCERIKYGSDKIQDIIFDLADPEINGGFKSLAQINLLLNKVDID